MTAQAKKVPSVRLNREGPHRCLTGHPWVLQDEFPAYRDIAPGSEVDVVDSRGRFVGRGYYNPNAPIAIRIFSQSSRVHLDFEYFKRRINEALARRRRLLPEDEPHRLIFAEADRVPGVVVDVLGDLLRVDIVTLGMEMRRELLMDALIETFNPAGILESSHSRSRSREGLEPKTDISHGTYPERHTLSTDGIIFRFDLVHAKKEGLHLDQRITRRRFASYAAGARVLDAFAGHGHFSLYAAAGGAKTLLALDHDEETVDTVRENANLNNATIEIETEDAFTALKRLETHGRQFELISLDPPSMLSSDGKQEPKEAYEDLNIRALKMLTQGGILFSSCRSSNIETEEFRAFLTAAVRESGREVRLLETRVASPDHPVRLDMPETQYLKCFILRAE